MKLEPVLSDIFNRLLAVYGPQGWWPAETPFEVMIGAVLTQNTSWSNVERAMVSLKALTPLEPGRLLDLSSQDLQSAIRPSGYYRQKADRLRNLCLFLMNEFGGDTELAYASPTNELREKLLAVKGIGPETADSILLYALERPVFVVDTYTVRLLDRLGLLNGTVEYLRVQGLFWENLPEDSSLFNEYHALIVVHGKERCRKNGPLCGGCELFDLCRYGKEKEPGVRSQNPECHEKLI